MVKYANEYNLFNTAKMNQNLPNIFIHIPYNRFYDLSLFHTQNQLFQIFFRIRLLITNVLLAIICRTKKLNNVFIESTTTQILETIKTIEEAVETEPLVSTTLPNASEKKTTR